MFFQIRPSPPSILRATKAEQMEAIEKLIEPTTLRRGYYLILILSVSIITAGLLSNNTAVIIGGMILAPLLLPILSLSLSVVTSSIKGILHSLKVLGLSLVITLLLAYGMTLLFTQTSQTIAWIPGNISTELYLFIAFCSGVAAAFAWVKEDFAPSIAGIAIAVSLLPPLCAVGIAAAFRDAGLAESSLLLFLLNLAGILVGAVVVFLILGFWESRTIQEKVLAQSEK